tara:strand:+ start:90 stop:923 length:834 start_codon:yes stop_codon:yes gene_type:complete
MKKIKYGIMQGRLSPSKKNLIQFFPSETWQDEFKPARKLGFKFIEWTLDYNNLNQNPLLNHKSRKKIKRLCKKYNIKIKSVTCDCFMEKPFWKIKNNDKYLLDFRNVVDASSKFGIKYLIIPLVDNGSLKNYHHVKKAIKVFQKELRMIKKKNVKILFESDFEPSALKKFIKRFDLKYFGINYDTGNSAGLGYDIDSEFNYYGKYVKNIHIKDKKFKGKTVRLGKGDAQFENLEKNIKRLKYKGLVVLQTARSKVKQDYNEAKINFKFIKEKLKNND